MEKRLKCGEEKTRGKKKDRTGRQSSEPAQGKTVESSQQTYQQQAETEIQLEDTSTNLQSDFQLPLRPLGNAHFYANTERNRETGRNKKTRPQPKPMQSREITVTAQTTPTNPGGNVMLPRM